MKYSSIYIEKTVDAFNNSIVGLQDTLEYSINIRNESNTKYDTFNVIENISEYVDIVDAGNGVVDNNTINWKIDNLNPGESVEINYKVKVKNDTNILDKKIISNGTVAGIPSSTITNTVSSNLNNLEKNKISEKAQELLSNKNYKGKELISQLYNNSVGFSLDLEDLDITKLIVTRNGTQYYPDGNANTPTIYLNTEDIYSKYVLSGYYGALYTNTSGTVYQKFYENSSSKISRKI